MRPVRPSTTAAWLDLVRACARYDRPAVIRLAVATLVASLAPSMLFLAAGAVLADASASAAAMLSSWWVAVVALLFFAEFADRQREVSTLRLGFAVDADNDLRAVARTFRALRASEDFDAIRADVERTVRPSGTLYGLRHAVIGGAELFRARTGSVMAAVILGVLGGWWLPVVLIVAWRVLHGWHRQIVVSMQAARSWRPPELMEAKYLRDRLHDRDDALEARISGGGTWLLVRLRAAWQDGLGEVWQARRAKRTRAIASLAVFAVAHVVVIWGLARAGLSPGQLTTALGLVLQHVGFGWIGESEAMFRQGAARALGDQPPASGPPASGRDPSEPLGDGLPESAAGLVVKELGFAYGDDRRRIIDGLTLAATPGTVTAVVGPNGSGKSTLCRLLANQMSAAHAGRIRFSGRAPDLLDRRSWWMRLIVLPQDLPGLPLPIADYCPVPVEGGLSEAGHGELPPQQLSSGQRRRLWLDHALARVRSERGRLVVLDEPTTHADPRATASFLDAVLAAGRAHDHVVVVATHDLAFAKRCDAVLALEESGSFDHGPPGDVFRTSSIVQRLMAASA